MECEWSSTQLTPEQRQYAANDVIHLLKAHSKLHEMITRRGELPTGITLRELHDRAQAMLPSYVELLVHGYGDEDMGWQTSLFAH